MFSRFAATATGEPAGPAAFGDALASVVQLAVPVLLLRLGGSAGSGGIGRFDVFEELLPLSGGSSSSVSASSFHSFVFTFWEISNRSFEVCLLLLKQVVGTSAKMVADCSPCSVLREEATQSRATLAALVSMWTVRVVPPDEARWELLLLVLGRHADYPKPVPLAVVSLASLAANMLQR